MNFHCSLFPLGIFGRPDALVELATIFLFTWVIGNNKKLYYSSLFSTVLKVKY
jgi:hypothetical protein